MPIDEYGIEPASLSMIFVRMSDNSFMSNALSRAEHSPHAEESDIEGCVGADTRVAHGRPVIGNLFSLVVERGGNELLEDGSYNVSHPHLKTARLFVSRNSHAGRSFEIYFT